MQIGSSTAPKLSIAQLNLWNMFDTVDDPRTRDMVATPQEYKARLEKLALTITTVLGTPDILSLNEIENETVLNDLLNLPSMRALGYKASIQSLNDMRGIRVAIAYRGALELVSTEAPNPTYPPGKNSNDGQIDNSLLFARAPLVANFRMTGLGQAVDGAANLTVIVNHLKSKIGGERASQRREAQGLYLGKHVDGILAKDPNRNVIVIGDLNSGAGEKTYQNLMLKPDGSNRFKDVMTQLSPEDRYSYIYRGKKEQLDHILVSGKMFGGLSQVSIPHINTAAGAANLKFDPTTAAGVSDHDPLLAVFLLKR